MLSTVCTELLFITVSFLILGMASYSTQRGVCDKERRDALANEPPELHELDGVEGYMGLLYTVLHQPIHLV
jgi:hypothetical protein